MKMRTWKRLGAVVGLVGVLGLAACSAEVDPSGDGVNVDVDASAPDGEDGVDDEGSE